MEEEAGVSRLGDEGAREPVQWPDARRPPAAERTAALSAQLQPRVERRVGQQQGPRRGADGDECRREALGAHFGGSR